MPSTASTSTAFAMTTTDMTAIACLGWGSLVWDPRQLLVSPPWKIDGPQVHIEFLRISDHREGRVTLVLDGSAGPVTSLWARMTTTDLATARESLRARERVPTPNMNRDIGIWCRGDASLSISVFSVVYFSIDVARGEQTIANTPSERLKTKFPLPIWLPDPADGDIHY
jgi:hypothetical protein